jgi:hypothetical protein
LFSTFIAWFYKKNIFAAEDLVFVDYIQTYSNYPLSGMRITFHWLVGWGGIRIWRRAAGISCEENDLVSDLILPQDE